MSKPTISQLLSQIENLKKKISDLKNQANDGASPNNIKCGLEMLAGYVSDKHNIRVCIETNKYDASSSISFIILPKIKRVENV